MFQSSPIFNYQQIFNARGEEYHRAMQAQPLARRVEFERVVALADLQSGHLIADMPAGGGYLRAFVPTDVRLISIETSETFARQNQSDAGDSKLLCGDLSAIPLSSGSLDRVISIAGAHHLPDKAAFYFEAYRLLRPGGVFVLADVEKDSRVAYFLNDWVHAHNSLGHKGVFLDGNVTRKLGESGFEVESAKALAYAWEFDSIPQMVDYCRGLFGIDRAADAQILSALKTILGVEEANWRVSLNWELLFVRASKPAFAELHRPPEPPS